MDAKIHSGNIKALKRDKSFWSGVAICLLLLNIMLIYFLYGKDTKVVISPPTVKNDYTINKDTADPKYLQEMGLYFTLLIGNLSDDNVDFVMQVMKRHMTRKLNKEIKAALFDQITAIKQNNMETTFDASDVISISSNEVQVKGTRKTYLNDELTEKMEMSYVWEFEIKNWFLYISDFSTNDPKQQ